MWGWWWWNIATMYKIDGILICLGLVSTLCRCSCNEGEKVEGKREKGLTLWAIRHEPLACVCPVCVRMGVSHMRAHGFDPFACAWVWPICMHLGLTICVRLGLTHFRAYGFDPFALAWVCPICVRMGLTHLHGHGFNPCVCAWVWPICVRMGWTICVHMGLTHLRAHGFDPFAFAWVWPIYVGMGVSFACRWVWPICVRMSLTHLHAHVCPICARMSYLRLNVPYQMGNGAMAKHNISTLSVAIPVCLWIQLLGGLEKLIHQRFHPRQGLVDKQRMEGWIWIIWSVVSSLSTNLIPKALRPVPTPPPLLTSDKLPIDDLWDNLS